MGLVFLFVVLFLEFGNPSRRFPFGFISKSKKRSSILIHTHNMTRYEKICTETWAQFYDSGPHSHRSNVFLGITFYSASPKKKRVRHSPISISHLREPVFVLLAEKTVRKLLPKKSRICDCGVHEWLIFRGQRLFQRSIFLRRRPERRERPELRVRGTGADFVVRVAALLRNLSSDIKAPLVPAWWPPVRTSESGRTSPHEPSLQRT